MMQEADLKEFEPSPMHADSRAASNPEGHEGMDQPVLLELWPMMK